MASAKTQPARGMRDFLPEDVRRREYVIGVIKEVYERYGFEPLETPAVENIETLMGKYGEEGNQLIFKILKRGVHESTGEADLALRYDLTVPLARVVAEYKDKLPKFFKRYQIQPVWRADRPAKGRFREFYQCDVDVLGSRSMVVEAEICAAASEVLKKLGFKDFTIRLNHRQLLKGILEMFGSPAEQHEQLLIAIDKLQKIGIEGVKQELLKMGIDEQSAASLIDTFSGMESSFNESRENQAWNRKTLEALAVASRKQRDLQNSDPPMREEQIAENVSIQRDPKSSKADQLAALVALVGESTPEALAIKDLFSIDSLLANTSAREQVKIDASLARGLSYYTGAIMEISVPDLAGSLGGGGRYDNLVGMFLGQDVPACGFSLGLERIIFVMTERGMFPADLVGSPADVMVTIWNEDSIGESLALAHELRSAGLRVDLYPETDKVGKQFKYASARGIPFVAVIGDDERAQGEVAFKNMKSGEQRSVKRENAGAELKALV